MRLKKNIVLNVLILFCFVAQAQIRRPMWVWNSDDVLSETNEQNILINQCIQSNVTDLYFYTPGRLSSTYEKDEMRAFIAKASCNNIRVWGMDGWRGYFSDLCGPDEFYENIQDVIDYNAESAVDEQFAGFHGDNEFHVNDGSTGCGPGGVFHNGTKDINLSTTSGGLWQASAKEDRDSLMTDFVRQTHHAAEMCHNAGIEYGIAVMPWITGVSWTNNAVGQQNTPLYAKYEGVTKPLFHHLLDYVDEYVVMSYHTNVASKVTLMCEDILDYADGLAEGVRPRIFSGLETYCNVGQYVSYCDTPGENTKSHVNSEMSQHLSLLGTHDSYTGVAIHDWAGWKNLPSVSNNTATPPGSACSTTSVKDKNLSSVSIFPQPANSEVTIVAPEGFEMVKIEVYDMNGVLMTSVPANTYSWNVAEWKSGMYAVRMENIRGEVQMVKLIVK